MQIKTLSVFEILSDCKVEAGPGEIIIWDGGQFEVSDNSSRDENKYSEENAVQSSTN